MTNQVLFVSLLALPVVSLFLGYLGFELLKLINQRLSAVI
ncbi:hypothetical protein PAUR_a0671 [Pseudoalteromonas aurantia 208]|uniref:Uncharacterized protein n=1 Tax=Pseudoalteromonas aurantia 208 TaxID=1314867 RepID=A0ABR9E8P2_9GAMM|nr:hypothetical protein [Pseudoalteromonas aurantia 208]